ncbi:hypothetical protein [Helicobacter sp. 23-1045]
MDCHDLPKASLAKMDYFDSTHPLNPPPQGRGRIFLRFYDSPKMPKNALDSTISSDSLNLPTKFAKSKYIFATIANF